MSLQVVRLVPVSMLILAACAGQQADAPFQSDSVRTPTDLQASVVSDDFAVGQPRVPVIFWDGAQRVADIERVTITAFDLSTDPPTPGWSGDATNYSDYEIPYWVSYPELPLAGAWGLGAEIILADGTSTKAEMVVQVNETSTAPDVGMEPPPSENRTLTTEPDIHKLSSGDDPDPVLYQMTVAEAVRSGTPTIVTFATPRFCTSRFCAPVVGSVEAVYEEFGDAANFIHIEIFKDFDTLDYADEVVEWGLTSEPWTYVLDADGIIVARFGGPISPRELGEALEPLLP